MSFGITLAGMIKVVIAQQDVFKMVGMKVICRNCDREANAPHGVCLIHKAEDGLYVRCVGLWAKDKYYYIERYLDVLTKSMRQRWQLYYIDLFSGCGKCRVRETGEEIAGSGLIALNLRFPFNNYYFIDLDEISLQSFKERVKYNSLFNRISFKWGDCNEKVMEILGELPKEKTLYVTLIDPTGLQIKFDTIRILTNERKMDLIVIFPQGMAIKRNMDKFIKKEDSLLDSFMGDRRWRSLYKSRLPGDSIEKSLIDLYRDNLKSIGYQEIKSADEILIKSSKRALPLYYLLFASKHPLGHQFWSSISEIEPTGQRKLKFQALI